MCERTDLYVTTHNIRNRRTSMPPSVIRTRNHKQASRRWLTPQTARSPGSIPVKKLVSKNYLRIKLLSLRVIPLKVIRTGHYSSLNTCLTGLVASFDVICDGADKCLRHSLPHATRGTLQFPMPYEIWRLCVSQYSPKHDSWKVMRVCMKEATLSNTSP